MTVSGSSTKIYKGYYYDVKGRVTKVVQNNLLGGYDVTNTVYTFTGQPATVTHSHTASGKSTRTEVYTYSYDHADRVSKVEHTLGGTKITLADYTYDSFGRLSTKSLHGSAANKLTYAYNLRSWLTGITSTRFTQNLYYNTGVGTARYNGNISSMTWKSGNESTVRGYKFTYDGLDRMLNATYGETAGISTNANRFSENVTGYDKNGNIKGLQRYGQLSSAAYGMIDNLTLTLNGNQLNRVDDAVTASAYNGGFEFKNGANAADEYSYDANGNLTKDLNKGISGITYNFLNLPNAVTFSDGSTITYTYGADGTKLRTVHKIGSTTTTTDYCGNVIYENGVQKLLLTEEGYITLSDSKYHYYLKDHQGNNRVVISQSGTVEETSHYYPFGGTFESAGNVQRYKYNGTLNFNYSNVRVGDKGEPDFLQQNNFQLYWQHTQDPKANPGSTFSASVDFRTSGYNRYSATSLNEALQTQTSSTISYSKSWLGTPFSLSANMSVSQNSQSGTLSIALPNVVFNVSTFYPFKRKEAMGKQRWYEKISLRYTGKFNNKANAKESEIFTKETLQNMQYGFEHSIPISATYNIFNYINFGPTINYTEKWYFKKQEQVWNPVLNRIDKLDPEYGFYRLYNYNFSLQASTIIYGRYEAKKKTRKVQAIRHTITPTVSFSYAPDFSKQKYGYVKTVQSDTLGNFKTYSPFEGSIFGVPSSGQSMAINASLSQTLEMKVLSKRDTSGMKKIKLIDELRIGQVSYNFLADSMGLSNIPISLRTTVFQNFGININATLDPYRVTPQGQRINKLFFPGRVVSASTSFGYTFQSRQDNSTPAINDINSAPVDPAYANPFYDPYGQMNPALRRQYMTQAYYDFSLPWNLGFNYTISYSASPTNNGTTGYQKNITQTLGINGSVTILPKMGVTIQGGYDFQAKELTPASITITRDLHCWQMSFAWVPFGHYQSWSFNIGVKAASLADLKYDKSQSMFDNLY